VAGLIDPAIAAAGTVKAAVMAAVMMKRFMFWAPRRNERFDCSAGIDWELLGSVSRQRAHSNIGAMT
jgi:hypothetical protein